MKEIIRRVLIADEGMALTNGDRYCSAVSLGVGADGSEWREVPISEAKETLSENEVEGI